MESNEIRTGPAVNEMPKIEADKKPTIHEHFSQLLYEHGMEKFKVTDMTDVTYEFLEKVQLITKTITHEGLRGNLRSEPFRDEMMVEKPDGPLATLSKYSWSYFIRSKSSDYQEPLDTLVCILINICS